MHAYNAMMMETHQYAYARVLCSLCIISQRFTTLSGMNLRTKLEAGRPISQVIRSRKKGDAALPASVVQCMDKSISEDDCGEEK